MTMHSDFAAALPEEGADGRYRRGARSHRVVDEIGGNRPVAIAKSLERRQASHVLDWIVRLPVRIPEIFLGIYREKHWNRHAGTSRIRRTRYEISSQEGTCLR